MVHFLLTLQPPDRLKCNIIIAVAFTVIHLLNPFFLDLLDPIKGLAALEVDLQHGLHLLPILPALLSLALLIPPVLPQVGAGHL